MILPAEVTSIPIVGPRVVSISGDGTDRRPCWWVRASATSGTSRRPAPLPPAEQQSELQMQTRCLVLEFSVFPRTAFIPPAVLLRQAGPRVSRITLIEAGDEHR